MSTRKQRRKKERFVKNYVKKHKVLTTSETIIATAPPEQIIEEYKAIANKTSILDLSLQHVVVITAKHLIKTKQIIREQLEG